MILDTDVLIWHMYIERYYLSHSLEIADALIAATAAINALPLLTGNDRHYKIVFDLEIRTFFHA